MGAFLMGLAGAYRDTPYPRVESLAEFVIDVVNPPALTRVCATFLLLLPKRTDPKRVLMTKSNSGESTGDSRHDREPRLT